VTDDQPEPRWCPVHPRTAMLLRPWGWECPRCETKRQFEAAMRKGKRKQRKQPPTLPGME
jgi:rubredoxin